MGGGDGGRDLTPYQAFFVEKCCACGFKLVLDVEDRGCVVCGKEQVMYSRGGSKLPMPRGPKLVLG
jgi:hypothetical protein